MSVLNEKAIEDLKWNYNYNLRRYNKGCEYCNTHKSEIEKWLPELLDILDNINTLLDEIIKQENVTEQEIIGGFKLIKK